MTVIRTLDAGLVDPITPATCRRGPATLTVWGLLISLFLSLTFLFDVSLFDDCGQTHSTHTHTRTNKQTNKKGNLKKKRRKTRIRLEIGHLLNSAPAISVSLTACRHVTRSETRRKSGSGGPSFDVAYWRIIVSFFFYILTNCF